MATTILAKVKIDGIRAGDVVKTKFGDVRIPVGWDPGVVKGGNGIKYINPNNQRNIIRIMYPTSSPYNRPNGYITITGTDGSSKNFSGNTVLKKSAEAHFDIILN